jgi:hypothetical protein
MNKELEIYKKVTDTVKLSKTFELLNIKPHGGQQTLVDIWDNQRHISNVVAVCGRRFGKSTTAGGIGFRELLVPFSRVALIAPVYANGKIIWQEIVKYVYQVGLKPKSINNQQMHLELENGSKLFVASEDSIESLLGNRFSLIIFEETQSIDKIDEIYGTYLSATLSDYGVREDGSFYGRCLFIGTPRGKNTTFYEYFCKEYDDNRWKSLTAPSSDNPINTPQFLEAMRKTVGELRFRQEYLAEFVSVDSSDVFFNFKTDRNLFKKSDILPFINESSVFIAGIDVGFNDSTAYVLVHKTPNGSYFVLDAYIANQKTTKQHVDEFRKLEKTYIHTKYSEPTIRYLDKSAAQSAHDLAYEYNFITTPSKSAVKEGVDAINNLFLPTGVAEQPKLFIEENLKELIKQLLSLQWANSKNTKDPFKRIAGHHYDLVHALRYAIYSDYLNSGQSVFFL